MLKNMYEWVVTQLYRCDSYGDPVSISFKGKSTHPTALGGLSSILLLVGISIYVEWRIELFLDRSRDQYFMSNSFKAFSDIGAFYLRSDEEHNEHKSMYFEIYVNDEQWDNDDNEYATFKLHRYTNMNDVNDVHDMTDRDHRDEIVPLKICEDKITVIWQKANITKYCPDFSEDDYLYGDYIDKRFSWYRLAIHLCEEKERSK